MSTKVKEAKGFEYDGRIFATFEEARMQELEEQFSEKTGNTSSYSNSIRLSDLSIEDEDDLSIISSLHEMMKEHMELKKKLEETKTS